MAVYVDSQQTPYGRMRMSHLLADTLEELHAAAARLGLQRKWFQDHRVPHYDLCQAKRRLAVALGAIALDRRETAALARKLRLQHSRPDP